jgi:DNA recombination protein RmuC
MMTIVLLIVSNVLIIALILFVLLTRGKSSGRPEIKEIAVRMESMVKDEISRNREEYGKIAGQSRKEAAESFTAFQETILKQMAEIVKIQTTQSDVLRKQVSDLTQSNEGRLEKLRETIEIQLKSLREDNTRKLEEMRKTVDEKLHETLEKRLGESFKIVSERLELVHKGLGEMQSLATGVGDLKKVLTNVKVRGTWGEAQLASLLEQYFSPEQYEKNVAVRKNSADRVEFAIKLPGKDTESDTPVYLAIDSKFPQEDYNRLIEAQEQANPALVEQCSKALEIKVKSDARTIRDKYINPPVTTDFAIMFLPTESLYAEVLRRPGSLESIIREFKVIITGPTTCAALLSSLQVGFRTLVVEKRSAEIWKILGAVKTEFGKFGDLLEKTHKKMLETSNVIEDAAKKSRTIEGKLRKVQELPAQEADDMLELDDKNGTFGPEDV